MFKRIVLFLILLPLASCVSTLETPRAAPPPTLPVATGIPVTPKPKATRVATLVPTLQTMPTPENVAEMFRDSSALLKIYQPPATDSKPLSDALANGIGEFLQATANGDVSLEEQPALEQLRVALGQIENMPNGASPQVAAIHAGDDQGGSRDLVLVAIQGVMGLPIVALERLGATYETLAPVSLNGIADAEARSWYPGQLHAHDVTGDTVRELIYSFEYAGAGGTTNVLTVARWLADKKRFHPLFRASLVNWAGEADYQIETTADASTIRLAFPWFGAFDHKLLAHPNAVQTWEYNDAQDRFVRVSQTVAPAKTARQQLNAAEYAFRNGDMNGAAALYERAWRETDWEKEDFGESKADPAAFAKFRQAMVLGLLGRDTDAKELLNDVARGGEALRQLANVYAKNSSGKDGALRGWIAMANAGELYELIFASQAGNLDFPFEAREIYAPGAIVAAYLNTHAEADKNPDALWSVLTAWGFKTTSRAAADLDGDGTNEFFVVVDEGASTPNRAQGLWFIYRRDKAWRARSIQLVEMLQIQGERPQLANGSQRALRLKLPDAFTPNEIALTWDGTRIIWLDSESLEPNTDLGTIVGGGVLEDDF